ncbi:ABC transporter permease [Nanoarchaeota archaeon]
MKLDYLKYSVTNLINRKMRSWLTILSILIGIMAIYSLLSFGQGLTVYVDDIATQMGKDKITIMPKGAGFAGLDENFRMSEDDVDFIRKRNEITDVVGLYFDSVEVEYKKEKKYTFAIGVPTGGPEKKLVEEMMTVDMSKGRWLKESDKYKIMMGYLYQIPNKIFTRPLRIGDKLMLNGEKFEVVGFMGEIGNPQDDSQIYLTEDMMKEFYEFTDEDVAYMMARVAPDKNPSEIVELIQEKLRKFKGEEKGKESFEVQTLEDMIAAFGDIILVLNGILIIIAMISVVVASVNIMNTMYTAVLERTKEIGVMKAIGAKNSDIMTIFMIESGLLGLVGGALGILFGYGVASAGGAIAAGAGYSFLKPLFPTWLTVGCLLFAFFVGTAAGLFPSINASKLKPVDSLRYE